MNSARSIIPPKFLNVNVNVYILTLFAGHTEKSLIYSRVMEPIHVTEKCYVTSKHDHQGQYICNVHLTYNKQLVTCHYVRSIEADFERDIVEELLWP